MAKRGSNNTIEITVNVGNGDITVRPGYAHFAVNKKITWSAPAATSLLITFKDGTAVGSSPPAEAGGERGASHALPLGLVELRGDAEEGKAPGVWVNAYALKPGMFAYQLALVVGGKVYADPSCPEIIIQ